MSIKDERTFVLKFWSGIFFVLGYISPFQIIRKLFGKDRNDGRQAFVKSYLFVDTWVTGNLALSFLAICIVKYTDIRLVSKIIVIYGLLRVFEVFIYQVNVLLFDEYRSDVKKDKEEKEQNQNKKNVTAKNNYSYALRSYRRIVILLLNNFFEIIFWFSSAYLYLSAYFSPDLKENTILEIIYKSFVKMTNFGSTTIEPRASLGIEIIWLESFIGLFMTLLVLARFIGMLPKTDTLEKNEEEK